MSRHIQKLQYIYLLSSLLSSFINLLLIFYFPVYKLIYFIIFKKPILDKTSNLIDNFVGNEYFGRIYKKLTLEDSGEYIKQLTDKEFPIEDLTKFPNLHQSVEQNMDLFREKLTQVNNLAEFNQVQVDILSFINHSKNQLQLLKQKLLEPEITEPPTNFFSTYIVPYLPELTVKNICVGLVAVAGTVVVF